MKVVLFCGGRGLRIREHSGSTPKPMVCLGRRPILWHVMKYYAHYGHKDFILCLGHKGETIKDYFLRYNECVSNNFTFSQGGKKIELASKDIDDWRITFVDTGMNSLIGERLLAVRRYLEDDEMFLANYSDSLTDFHLPRLISSFTESRKVAGFLCVKPFYSFHLVETNGDNDVYNIKSAVDSNMWLNGGYFVLRREIFDYMNSGEELVNEPFQRLIELSRLMAVKHTGFWACMDTFKEKQHLEEMYEQGNAKWQVWKKDEAAVRGLYGRLAGKASEVHIHA